MISKEAVIRAPDQGKEEIKEKIAGARAATDKKRSRDNILYFQEMMSKGKIILIRR